MAFSQADIDALDAAMKTGLLSVRYPDGSQMTYRSLAEMRELRAAMAADVAQASGASALGGRRVTVAEF